MSLICYCSIMSLVFEIHVIPKGGLDVSLICYSSIMSLVFEIL